MGRRRAPAAGMKAFAPYLGPPVKMGDRAIDLQPLKRPRRVNVGIVATGTMVPAHRAKVIAVNSAPRFDAAATAVVVCEQGSMRLVPLKNGYKIVLLDEPHDRLGAVETELHCARSQVVTKRGQPWPKTVTVFMCELFGQRCGPQRHSAAEIQFVLEENR